MDCVEAKDILGAARCLKPRKLKNLSKNSYIPSGVCHIMTIKPKSVRKPEASPSIHFDSGQPEADRIGRLEKKFSAVQEDLAGLREQVASLTAQNQELSAQLAKALAERDEALEAKAAAEAALAASKPKPRELVSYADLASLPAPPKVVGVKRPISVEEVARIQAGRGPTARTEFVRLYFEGQRKNKLSLVRSTFRFAGCDMRAVLDISFVGSSVMMVLARAESKQGVITALESIKLKYLSDFDELDAKWMARSIREKGNPTQENAVKALALTKFVARLTARMNLATKASSTHGYYARVIREAEASLKELEMAAAQSEASTMAESEPCPPEGEAMEIVPLKELESAAAPSVASPMATVPISEPSSGLQN